MLTISLVGLRSTVSFKDQKINQISFIGLLTNAIVRIFFMLIQVILMLIFENRMHLGQYKVMLRVLSNSLGILMAIRLNPFYSYILIRVITAPLLNRLENKYKLEIEKALDSDYRIEYYVPMSKKRQRKKQ